MRILLIVAVLALCGCAWAGEKDRPMRGEK